MLQRENVLIVGDKQRFANRQAAGALLAPHVKNRLCDVDMTDVVVLGLPRGGMVVAAPIAHELGVRLDFVITRRLLAPNQPALAIGAVTERGRVFLNKPVIDALGVTQSYIDAAIEAEQQEIQASTAVYRSIVPPVDLAGKVVVLVDDNVVTGSTMFATLRGLWAERPNRIILAIPIAPRDTLMALGDFADCIIALRAPADSFTKMDDYYDEFGQTTEEEVVNLFQAFETVV